MAYQVILFDLDGTLTDPAEGITNSIIHSLTYYGITVADKRELYDFIGPPLPESYMRRFGMDETTALEATEHFREYFGVKGLLENQIYPGIESMLRQLQAAGKTLLVATSKPEGLAVEIMDKFGLTPYFDRICGASLDRSRSCKEDVIAYLLACNGTAENMIMVGDTHYDVEGAAAHGIPTIGVSWGYGKVEDMEKAGAVAIAYTMDALFDLLVK